jgi:hypothetical protein
VKANTTTLLNPYKNLTWHIVNHTNNAQDFFVEFHNNISTGIGEAYQHVLGRYLYSLEEGLYYPIEDSRALPYHQEWYVWDHSITNYIELRNPLRNYTSLAHDPVFFDLHIYSGPEDKNWPYGPREWEEYQLAANNYNSANPSTPIHTTQFQEFTRQVQEQKDNYLRELQASFKELGYLDHEAYRLKAELIVEDCFSDDRETSNLAWEQLNRYLEEAFLKAVNSVRAKKQADKYLETITENSVSKKHPQFHENNYGNNPKPLSPYSQNPEWETPEETIVFPEVPSITTQRRKNSLEGASFGDDTTIDQEYEWGTEVSINTPK